MSQTLKPVNLLAFVATVFVLTLAWSVAPRASAEPPAPQKQEVDGARETEANSAGCLTCHKPDRATMHAVGTGSQPIGCTNCHGGNARVMRAANIAPDSPAGRELRERAHVVKPKLDIFATSANPAGVWYEALRENLDFIKFNNPGDLRVANETCGRCHATEVNAVGSSMMRHGGVLWGAALYNNGSYPFKDTQFGEFYMNDGTPARVNSLPAPTPLQTAQDGILAFLQPLFPWQVSQPGNILRVFERGGRKPLEVGNPDVDEEPGRPRNRLSNRGLGTLNRTDPVFIGLQKTRLLDPTLNFTGSNDAPGDYRNGGCTACHVVYANDRSEVHAPNYSDAGNEGRSQSSDPMIPKTRSGHPIKHEFTRSIPTSQCMTCHMHPGTNMVAPYQGMTWWDNETDGDKMYPQQEKKLSEKERAEIEKRNPEGSALRGLWSDPQFLQRTGSADFNKDLKLSQFADFHGHGWIYRAVFKRDRKGNLIDADGKPVKDTSALALADAVAFQDVRPAASRNDDDEFVNARGEASDARMKMASSRSGKPVHLKDIHLERGMQCVDCHFKQDNHGNGKLYNEPRAAVEITCVDCHGSSTRYAFNQTNLNRIEADDWTLRTTGPAAPEGGTNLKEATTPFGPRFELEVEGEKWPRLVQRSMVDRDLSWVVPQIKDSNDRAHPSYNEKSALAKTIQKDNRSWGNAGAPQLAHTDERMSCTTCHSSWITSCFGCHLSQTANQKKPSLHNTIEATRNWTSYNFQVLRDDVFMIGKDGTSAGGRISPVRSSSAVVVSSQDANRQTIYAQQQTISAEGYSGQAFNTHVPHTVRTTETKTCTDCHVSADGDNNAVMSQLLLMGTNFVNFVGRFVYVGTGHGGVEAISVTETSEPQAVIGSDLHKLAYPTAFAEHQRRNQALTTSIHHGSSNALGVQARGEYLYIADGDGGFRVFDIAQINQKGFSEKIVTAPVSRLGQNTNVGTRYATAVAAPSTLAVDPVRKQLPQNEEQKISPVYGYIYITDREEGLVLSTAATLLDGNPSNNFLKRAATFNPDGRLNGATNLAIAGNYAYITCARGLVIVDISTPTTPRIAGEIPAPGINKPTAVAVQFRYAFVTDADGLKIVDVTTPSRPRLTPRTVALPDARNVYVARTYAYVAAGRNGVAIVDVERPESPRLDQSFNAGGQLNDVNDIKVAMTNASVFAYVADGKNGLRVVQLVSANETAGAFGFSPKPTPKLIATYKTHDPALSISKGLDRDRAVDESGNQVAVFGRRGGRPLNQQEIQRMYLKDGNVWTVTDRPPAPARTSTFARTTRPVASHAKRQQ